MRRVLQAWWDLAEVYLEAGEREGAKGCLAQVQALGLARTHALGSHIEAVLTARLICAAGRFDDAAAGLRAELARAPQAPAVVAELGLLCARGDKCAALPPLAPDLFTPLSLLLPWHVL